MVDALVALVAPALGAPVFLRAGESYDVDASVPSPRWYLLDPVAADYQNPLACRGDCAVAIRYTWVELPALRGRSTLDVASVPELATPGTHRLRASAEALPAEATAADVDGTVELVVRRDDTYVGYASELVGVPFVLDPTGLPDGRHQTDARLGADCVALVVYGQRRLGRRVPYMSPHALLRFTEPAVGPVRAGDVLHFGFQTAILANDLGVVGVLDGPDLVLQTWHGLAEVLPFDELAYRDAPVQVLRWK